MLPVIIFDLDDTLYEEASFVRSGFQAVAQYGQREFEINAEKALEEMLAIETTIGRGKVFDEWLRANNRYSRYSVKKCVSIYRNHRPSISVDTNAMHVLYELADYPKYIVTDGNKLVQANKISALGINNFFDGIYITHRFGVANAKPSLLCFEKIKARENCEWTDMIYVGDNPKKDFVNLNKRNATTIRILQGPYKNYVAASGYDAEYAISDIRELPKIVMELKAGIESRKVAAHS